MWAVLESEDEGVSDLPSSLMLLYFPVVFVSFSIAFKIVSASLKLFKNMVLLSVFHFHLYVDKCVYI